MTTSDSFYPSSRRIYIPGKIHPDVRVSLREISQSPTRLPDGRTEENSTVGVYDTSGPWGDPAYHGEVGDGLPP
jgi:phosphomethylpyrimidine synthase